jgi:hypothetical protein
MKERCRREMKGRCRREMGDASLGEGLFSARSTAKQVTQHKTRYDATPNSQSRPQSALPVNLSELWYFIVKCPPLILNGSRIYVVLVNHYSENDG